MRFGIAFIMLIVAGCATTLSLQASKIEAVTEDRIDSNYVFLGNVVGTSGLTGIACDKGFNNAMNECLEKAAELGATKIVFDPTCKATYWTTSEIARAKAYKLKR